MERKNFFKEDESREIKGSLSYRGFISTSELLGPGGLMTHVTRSITLVLCAQLSPLFHNLIVACPQV